MERALSRRAVAVLAGVAAVQATHVVEHIIQTLQIYVFHVPEARALGALGAVFEFHGTEEWLHLTFNLALASALIIFLPDIRAALGSTSPQFRTYLVLGVGVETWHVIEHLVVTAHMIGNGGGCPCPGIVDRVLPEVPLHLGYNVLAMVGLLAAALPIIARARVSGRPSELLQRA